MAADAAVRRAETGADAPLFRFVNLLKTQPSLKSLGWILAQACFADNPD
jgi:hypothetical protein